MKISEMNNEQATEAIIRLSAPISNICDDEEAVKLFDEIQHMEGIPMIQMIGKMLPKFAQYALAKHKMDFYEIVGALTAKKASEVAKMKFVETIQIVKDSYDEVLAGFFHSSRIAVKGKGHK